MLEVVGEVQGAPTCPLVVSCRDGSTSTGLLLAAYKLWLDLGDPSCCSLALLPTVAALRWPLPHPPGGQEAEDGDGGPGQGIPPAGPLPRVGGGHPHHVPRPQAHGGRQGPPGPLPVMAGTQQGIQG